MRYVLASSSCDALSASQFSVIIQKYSPGQKFGHIAIFNVYIRGWTTSDFLKSTFKWWKSSRSRLVAYDVINEQISLELWLKHLVHSWHMTQRCPHSYCSYSSSFWSVLSSLGHYISHRFLLVRNQIQIKLHSKDYTHMNALVRAIACVN